MFDTVYQLSGLPALHGVAEEATLRFMESTSDDTGELEAEMVSMLGDLWHGRNSAGNMTSGGTESNFDAMRAALKLSGRTGGNIIVPNTIHRSILKAADWMGLKAILVPVDSSAVVSPEKVRKAVRSDTIAIAATCTTNPYGTIDPIEELGEIAEQRGLYLHVDAAFGGFYCPWVERLGRPVRRFDFRVKGVSSIASDPHKSGYGIYPAGCIVYRDEAAKKAASFDISKLPLGYKPSRMITQGLLGGRPAIGVAAAWAVFNYLGAAGYLQLVKRCEEAKDELVSRLREVSSLEPVAVTQTNLLAIMSKSLDLVPVKKALREKGWVFAGSNGAPRTFQSNILVVFGASHPEKYKLFMEDLAEAAK